MSYAATDLGRLFVQCQGRGEPVTFWNCLFGDSTVYRGMLRANSPKDAVADKHQVVLVEGPSHGRSQPLRRLFTLEQCADAWVQALDHMGVTQPAVFCGLSWGSMVALRVALRHPERVRGLFLMSTIATAPRPRFVPQFLALATAVRVFGFPDWLIRKMEPGMVAPEVLCERPDVAFNMLSRNRHLDRRAFSCAATSVLVRPTDIVDQLWRVRAPTWVVVGRRDLTTPVRASRTVANAIEGAEIRILEGVGHLVALEAPREARQLLGEALDAIESANGLEASSRYDGADVSERTGREAARSEAMGEVVEYTIQPSDAGERLDVVVVRALKGAAGRSRVRDLFAQGAVKVQGRVAAKGWRARAGNVISVEVETLDPAAVPEPEAELDVRLERADLVLVYKPAGQPTAPIHAGERGTLANALVGRYPEMAGVGYRPREPGIVHRLDTDTSGLVLAARTAKCFDVVSRALREGTLHKEYLVICKSEGLADSGIIDIPIGVEGKQSRKVVACMHPEELRRCDPRSARTSYRVLDRHGCWALVLAEAPKAVRHQLRAHFAAIEHPLAGDELYGGDTTAIGRHALHAHAISFLGRGDVEGFDVRSDMPEDMARLLSTAEEAEEASSTPG